MIILIAGTYSILNSISFIIPNEKNIIIVGDSLTECAIDDNIFSRAVNLSQGGTANLYTYAKLMKFFDSNVHIEKVILSFNGGSIEKSRDEWTIDKEYIFSKLPNYFFLLKKEELLLLANKSGFFSAILKSPVRNIFTLSKYILNKEVTYNDMNIGGFYKLDRNKLKEAIELRNNEEGQIIEYSQYQLIYLQKILQLCRQNNIELILLNTPTYNSEKYGYKTAQMNYYNNYLSDIKFLDFSDFNLPEYGYGDIIHLNYHGAEIFSLYLEENYNYIFNQ